MPPPILPDWCFRTARYTANEDIISIEATKTFPARMCQRPPLRKMRQQYPTEGRRFRRRCGLEVGATWAWAAFLAYTIRVVRESLIQRNQNKIDLYGLQFLRWAPSTAHAP